MSISPWSPFAEAPSPDARLRAVFEAAHERGMGAPWIGVVRVLDAEGRERARFAGASPSLLWSPDGGRLCVLLWSGAAETRLVLWRAPDGPAREAAERFGLLELIAFDGPNRLVARDHGPARRVREIMIDLRAVFGDGAG